jgi:hypothetical protein
MARVKILPKTRRVSHMFYPVQLNSGQLVGNAWEQFWLNFAKSLTVVGVTETLKFVLPHSVVDFTDNSI